MKRTELPTRVEENVAYTAELARWQAPELRSSKCEELTPHHDRPDLFGLWTYLECSPPRLCSRGPDGRRHTADDTCSLMGQGRATANWGAPDGVERHFIDVERGMRPGCGSPIAAVVEYYAALLRRDGSHRRALPPRSDWDSHLRWTVARDERLYFRTARLDGVSCDGDQCEVEVYLTLDERSDDRERHGTKTDLSVRGRGGEWRVEPPELLTGPQTSCSQEPEIYGGRPPWLPEFPP